MPGTVVTVAFPAAVMSAAAGKSIRIHIGCHTDSLWHKSPWVRLPEVVRRYTASSASTAIGSALGGLIYITLPSGLSLGLQDVTITGAIAAPQYVHGTTSVADWQGSIRSRPAPWGEVGSSKLIICTQRAAMMKLDDPLTTMNYWDKVRSGWTGCAAVAVMCWAVMCWAAVAVMCWAVMCCAAEMMLQQLCPVQCLHYLARGYTSVLVCL
jgi:hypothetical protein